MAQFTHIHPKLPMRQKAITRQYYIEQLGFSDVGSHDFPDYLILKKDQIELHFFLFPDLDPTTNDGQVYIRVEGIETIYRDFIARKVAIHPNGPLQVKPWGQKEFALLDPDHNLLIFGESVSED